MDMSPLFTSIFYHSYGVGFYLRQFIFHKPNKYNKAPASLVSKELKLAKKFHPEYQKNLYCFIAACSAFTINEGYFFFYFFLSCLNIGVLLSNPLPAHNVSATFGRTDPFLEWTLAWWQGDGNTQGLVKWGIRVQAPHLPLSALTGTGASSLHNVASSFLFPG